MEKFEASQEELKPDREATPEEAALAMKMLAAAGDPSIVIKKHEIDLEAKVKREEILKRLHEANIAEEKYLSRLSDLKDDEDGEIIPDA